MEKHKCKLCLKTFRDGRALGGHMRSHMLNLYSKEQLSENTESARSDECADADADEDVNVELIYELRENPKRNTRFVDHEFSFPIDAGSVVVEDSASETESSKNPIRRRSKRIRKLVNVDHHQWQFQSAKKAMKSSKLSKTESDPMSSISDTTPEENVAFCLMMLSRDIWKRDELEDDDDDDDEYEVEHEKYTYVEADESYSYSDNDEQDVKTLKSTRTRTKYKCETCNKVFKSYQALGGHRASHKKIKLHQNQNNHNPNQNIDVLETDGNSTMVEEKIHECPVCYRVFSSGQALGGHKRSHVTGSYIPIVAPVRPVAKHADNNLIDLNLPAPIEEDDCSQIELSAVSDAEFVNLMKR